MEYEEEGMEIVWLDEEEEKSQWSEDGSQGEVNGESRWSEVSSPSESLEGDITQDSYQLSAISNQVEESQWSEVGGLSESLEQEVTADVDPQIPAFARNDQPHGEEEVDGESRWLEVGSELVVDKSAEEQERCVTTEVEERNNFLPFEGQKEENPFVL